MRQNGVHIQSRRPAAKESGVILYASLLSSVKGRLRDQASTHWQLEKLSLAFSTATCRPELEIEEVFVKGLAAAAGAASSLKGLPGGQTESLGVVSFVDSIGMTRRWGIAGNMVSQARSLRVPQ
jgi:hypothetical protein